MKTYPNQIKSISELIEVAKTSIICLTDIANDGVVKHCFLTSNIGFINFHFGQKKAEKFKNKRECLSEESIVLFDILKKKPLKMVPTLFTGVVQKTCSFNKPDSSSDSLILLDFDTMKFVNFKDKKVTLISKLRNGDFRYVVKSKDTIYQVDKYGINIHGEQVVKNKLSTVSENEINGYLLFDKNTYPIFVSREYVSIVDLKNYFALPCFSLRNEDSTLNELIVLANKAKGE